MKYLLIILAMNFVYQNIDAKEIKKFQYMYKNNGKDHLWFTSDDEIERIIININNEEDQYEEEIIILSPGTDKKWLTADDEKQGHFTRFDKMHQPISIMHCDLSGYEDYIIPVGNNCGKYKSLWGDDITFLDYENDNTIMTYTKKKDNIVLENIIERNGDHINRQLKFICNKSNCANKKEINLNKKIVSCTTHIRNKENTSEIIIENYFKVSKKEKCIESLDLSEKISNHKLSHNGESNQYYIFMTSDGNYSIDRRFYNESDSNGNIIATTTYFNPGVDGIWNTDDDIIWNNVKFFYENILGKNIIKKSFESYRNIISEKNDNGYTKYKLFDDIKIKLDEKPKQYSVFYYNDNGILQKKITYDNSDNSIKEYSTFDYK